MANNEAKFFSINDLGDMPPPRWVIEDMFEANSLVMVAGPPGSFKSFLVLDWMLCMACGRRWNLRATEPSKVLYVLGEGRASLLKRIKAWEHYNRVTRAEEERLNHNFKVTFDVPQMAQRASVDNLLASLSEEEFKPDVIAIDTFARSFVGMDENSQKDVGMWIDSADRLRSAGFTVIFLHHTAKNTEFGLRYRGSTAIMGAMDTAMTLSREMEVENGIKLQITKQKDHDEGEPMLFQRVVVNPPGAPDSSVVLAPFAKSMETTMEREEKERAKDNLEKSIHTYMLSLIVNPDFETDTERAKHLYNHFSASGMTVSAAQMRISRQRKLIKHLEELNPIIEAISVC